MTGITGTPTFVPAAVVGGKGISHREASARYPELLSMVGGANGVVAGWTEDVVGGWVEGIVDVRA